MNNIKSFFLFFSFIVLSVIGLRAENNVISGYGQMKECLMQCHLLKGVSERPYSIYLPASYTVEVSRRYPVLYLLHGGGGAHTDWDRFNRLSSIADSLSACGAMDEMIIVCAEGNQNNMMYFNADEETVGAPDWHYEDYFFQELIPYIEKTYRVRSGRDNRAIGGFSMGGGGAVVYGVHHPETFVMVYDISGYLRRQPLEFLKGDPSAEWRQQVIEKNNPVRHVLSGTDDEVKAWRGVDWRVAVGDQDFTLEANMDLVAAFRRHGIPYSFYVNIGWHDHRWVSAVLPDMLRRASANFKRSSTASQP